MNEARFCRAFFVGAAGVVVVDQGPGSGGLASGGAFRAGAPCDQLLAWVC